jgi:hypothetical protein
VWPYRRKLLHILSRRGGSGQSDNAAAEHTEKDSNDCTDGTTGLGVSLRDALTQFNF